MPLNTDDLAVVIADAIKAATAPLQARIDALEAARLVLGEKGLDGKDGRDGKDAEVDLDALAVKVAGLIPAPKDGQDGAPGRDGADGPMGPAGEKGLDGQDGRDGQPGVPGVAGRDGIDGKDGAPGPEGQKGLDGKDGRDGTLEQLKAVFDGERTVTWCFKDGTPIEGGVWKLPVPVYKDIWKRDRPYEAAELVTYEGSQWIAKADSQGKQPGTADGSAFWKLVVKRGDQGKPGPKGEKGDKGEKGLDLRPSDLRLR